MCVRPKEGRLLAVSCVSALFSSALHRSQCTGGSSSVCVVTGALLSVDIIFSVQTEPKAWCIVWMHMRVDPSTLVSSSLLCLQNLTLCTHDFSSTLFPSPLLFYSLHCVCLCVCCENVSTVRIAPLLRLRLVFRKIMEVLSAAQQRLDGVTAKL